MVTQGLSERRALTVVRMSAAALRYVPRPDPDPSLRDRIVAPAHPFPSSVQRRTTEKGGLTPGHLRGAADGTTTVK